MPEKAIPTQHVANRYGKEQRDSYGNATGPDGQPERMTDIRLGLDSADGIGVNVKHIGGNQQYRPADKHYQEHKKADGEYAALPGSYRCVW